jgi:signal transduction histidine kinase
VKLKVSLYTRFMFWVILLLCALFGAIIFVTQRREIRTLYDETRTRAVLIAQYMADMNFTHISRWDQEAVRSNMEDRISDDLPYIVFFDNRGLPWVASEWVTAFPGIIGTSGLGDNTTPDSLVVEPKRIRVGDNWIRILEVEIPIFPPETVRLWASVKIAHSLEPMYADIRDVREVILLIGLGGFVLGILGATLLARRITSPLKKLVDGTIRISKGDFSSNIDISTKDEIGDLARSFNDMTLDLLQTRRRMEEANRKLIQAEKLASIGRLAATIAHEIRNPLTSVKLNIQKVEEGLGLESLEREHLGLSLEGIDQIEKFVKELLNYTRAAELSLERFSLEQVMDESLKILRDVLVQKRVSLEKTYERDLPAVIVDADKIRQVFLNILRNASEAVGSAGIIQVSMGKMEENGRPKIAVRISDNGPGIPDADRETIFEPFFTTKPSGFGLGLANARKIVEQHSGAIQVDTKKGKGSTFIVTLPCEEDA